MYCLWHSWGGTVKGTTRAQQGLDIALTAHIYSYIISIYCHLNWGAGSWGWDWQEGQPCQTTLQHMEQWLKEKSRIFQGGGNSIGHPCTLGTKCSAPVIFRRLEISQYMSQTKEMKRGPKLKASRAWNKSWLTQSRAFSWSRETRPMLIKERKIDYQKWKLDPKHQCSPTPHTIAGREEVAHYDCLL